MPKIIAIAGASGSGKTTVANKLARHYSQDSVIISVDHYYKTVALRDDEVTSHNFDHPDCINFKLLAQHLTELKAGRDIWMPSYDFVTHKSLPNQTRVRPAAIIILEGILVLHAPELAGLIDTKIFVKTELDLCLIRRMKRDVKERNMTPEGVVEQYEKTVRPMYKQFVEPSKGHAQFILKNDEDNPAIDVSPVVDCLEGRITATNPFKPVKLSLFATSQPLSASSSAAASSSYKK